MDFIILSIRFNKIQISSKFEFSLENLYIFLRPTTKVWLKKAG